MQMHIARLPSGSNIGEAPFEIAGSDFRNEMASQSGMDLTGGVGVPPYPPPPPPCCDEASRYASQKTPVTD